MAISRAAATATLEDASEGSSRAGAVRAWWAARSFRGKLLVAGGGLVAVVVVIAAAVGSSAQAEVATATSGQGLDEGLFEIGTADDETSGNSDDDDDSSTNLAVECDFPGPSCEIDSENISAAALLCAEYSGCAFDEAQETCTVIEACTCLDTPESSYEPHFFADLGADNANDAAYAITNHGSNAANSLTNILANNVPDCISN
ncbi:Hypothetical Protein FCC1311_032242 [Hondaea fermentalgiana]|uniref:Uncharacterized protein n=1 Tax=Hondaea fermentalgiana TaxID=2315210 RepID=A0A2R5GFH8_9STRA|nr:Hypothetical Protein FCC1311_032242 [Hondaea fermentalgiana]|eukprot:GBG27001.1 Hypothetical Protein FCC1311_032242 [Hondaea fermentalgiana]